ncbi:N-acetylmuramoyl-L-alanine amidase [Inediibacterium massiliense]|uniref:N-acetylmuramoyl-L-alanine amidase n=1 Tax=Inediibacterium massiliense TaxID=1658111 RepID=UPI0006B4F18E|nr:N-acetylmuramoyl-L-alanine amidase [Inediibacterium massiliense]
MKKILLFLLIFTMFFSIVSTAFGQEVKNSIQVTDGMTGKNQKVYSVNLVMAGEVVHTDVPALLYTINWKSRTLVPIKFIVENLGAEIKWNQEKKEATIIADQKTIILKIDSNKALVNGKSVALPDQVPAKLLGYKENYRTMVPLRFIAEQLGMNIGWDQESATVTIEALKPTEPVEPVQPSIPVEAITDITYENSKRPQILIKTTNKVDFKTTYLEGSKYGSCDRLVLDVSNTNFKINDSSMIEGEGLIKKTINKDGIMTIRGSLFEPAPKNVSRIVIDLAMPKGYHVSYDEDQKGIKVEFVNSVNNIKVEKRNLVDAVVIQTEEKATYNKMDLGNRVVVDVLNASLKFNKSEVPISQVGIKKIRVAEFEPDQNYEKDDRIVRIVLDLDSMQSPENVFINQEGKDIVIYTSQKPIDTMNYEKVNNSQSLLKLSLKDEVKYDIDYDFNKNEMYITVPKDKIELKNALLTLDDRMIQTIKVEGKNDSYLLSIKMKEKTEYKIESSKTTDEIKIRFTNNTIISPSTGKKLIVIDAGHGGKDPGTHSTTPLLYEKNLALDTAKRLEQLLQAAGYNTYMTRNDDTFIELKDRPGAANKLNADLFVSIHFNWIANPEISGVQTLYVGNDPRNNKDFATIMQQELVKGLNATDKLIVHRPNLVVIRDTKMPAVLCEIAFLSNLQDSMKASTPEYRQKAAQAMLNGIERYLNEVK